jgi:hypothetical protein
MRSKLCALTFDDGLDCKMTARVLDKLEKHADAAEIRIRDALGLFNRRGVDPNVKGRL